MLEAVAATIRDGKRFLVTMHRRPDGDAMGSSLALAIALRELGKEVVHYNPDPVPYNLRFLPGTDDLVTELAEEESFDATFVCDCRAADRLGPHLPPNGGCGRTVILDHHGGETTFGDLAYVDPKAAAVGVLIWRILEHLGHPISRDVALGIYASIMTDTGSFRYDSTNPESLRVTGELIQAGVRPWEMASHIYESQPAARVRLLAEVLATLEVAHEGRYAFLTVTLDMLTRNGATEDMLDGFVNHARAVDGVEVAALFVELPEGGFKASFRSRGNYALMDVGKRLGGKGQTNAASAVIGDGLEVVKERAARAVAALFSDGPKTAVA